MGDTVPTRGVGCRCCAMEWRALASGLGSMFLIPRVARISSFRCYADRGQCQVLLYWCAGSRRTGAHVRVRCAQGDTSAGVWIVAAVPCKQGALGRQVEIYTLLCRCYTTSGGVRVCKRHRVHELVCEHRLELSWLVVTGVIRRCAASVVASVVPNLCRIGSGIGARGHSV